LGVVVFVAVDVRKADNPTFMVVEKMIQFDFFVNVTFIPPNPRLFLDNAEAITLICCLPYNKKEELQ
jgi:hypothetical protein